MTRRLALPALFLCSLVLTACVGSASNSPLLRSEPVVDGELTRAPRTLRLYFNALPDVSRSSLQLFGPSGEYPLRGLHTMADDDLMIEIMEPLSDGNYRVEWETALGADPALHRGNFNFTVNAVQR